MEEKRACSKCGNYMRLTNEYVDMPNGSKELHYVGYCDKCRLRYDFTEYEGIQPIIANNEKQKKQNDKRNKIACWILAILIIIGIFCTIQNHKDDTNQVDNEQAENEQDNTTLSYEDIVQDISDFEYEIKDDVVYLTDYSGDDAVLVIQSNYVIDGVTYETDLSDYNMISGESEFLILEDGIKEINNSAFNSTDLKYVYFPDSMEILYDKTLEYLHPDEDEKIYIYYEGAEEQWIEIFTEYERQTVSEAWNSSDDSEEKARALGESVANKLNEMMGSYEEENYSFSYSVSFDEIKEMAIDYVNQ